MALRYKGRRGRPYPAPADDLRKVIDYDPATGRMVFTKGQPSYSTAIHISRDGYNTIRIPISASHLQRGERICKRFRCDYLAWYYMTGSWPIGWLEHVDGMSMHDAMDNLVLCDLEGCRWWYGTYEIGKPREMIQVEGILGPDGSSGTLSYEQRQVDGTIRWVPKKKDAHSGPFGLAIKENISGELHEDYTFVPEKGILGRDWLPEGNSIDLDSLTLEEVQVEEEVQDDPDA